MSAVPDDPKRATAPVARNENTTPQTGGYAS